MKSKVIFCSLLVLAVVFATLPATAQTCTKIKDGGITDSAGNPVTLGFDQFGYNYQAHMFNGTYDGADRVFDNSYYGDNTGGYADDKLLMKWSDDWLSNLDCNGDHKLDRGGAAGANANISKGWLTNQVEGDYTGSDGDQHHYTYFAKIVYDGGSACQNLASSCIWGSYSIIEEIQNDTFGEYGGKIRNRLPKPGLGLNK